MSARSPRLPIVAGVLAAFALASLRPALADDRSETAARERIERLLPLLDSEDDDARERAEREVLALGEPGRRELERLSRDRDPRKAITALRLLSDDRWDAAARGDDRPERGRRGDEDAAAGERPELGAWEAEIERSVEDVRRRFEDLRRRLADGAARSFEFGFDEPAAGTTSSGTIVRDGRSFSWTLGADGRVRIATRDRADAAETVVEAESLDALRKDHPELAKRFDAEVPRGGGRTFRFPQTLDELWAPDDRTTSAPGPRADAGAAQPRLGIECSDVPDVLRTQLDLGAGGLVVERVVPGTLAERLGLRRHDVLVEVAGRPVATVEDVRAALAAAPAAEPVSAAWVRRGRRETATAGR